MGVPRVLARLPAEVRRSSRMITKTSGSSSTNNPSRLLNGYPVELDLVGKLAVVVGGGAVAARTPAVTRHGDITVAVTAGGDPRRSQLLRSAISHALADGSLPVRPHRRRPTPRDVAAGHGRIGTVALVGGGPGDPGLITV